MTVISDHPFQDFVEENYEEAVTVDQTLSSWYKWPTSKQSLKETEGNVTQVPLITKSSPVLVILFPFSLFLPLHPHSLHYVAVRNLKNNRLAISTDWGETGPGCVKRWDRLE